MQSNSRDYYGMLVQPFLASLLQRFLLACMRVKGESWLVQLRKWRQYAGCLRLFYSCVPQQHSVRTADVLLRRHPVSTCAEMIRNYIWCYFTAPLLYACRPD